MVLTAHPGTRTTLTVQDDHQKPELVSYSWTLQHLPHSLNNGTVPNGDIYMLQNAFLATYKPIQISPFVMMHRFLTLACTKHKPTSGSAATWKHKKHYHTTCPNHMVNWSSSGATLTQVMQVVSKHNAQ